MLDEGPTELGGEPAYYGVFTESAAGFPVKHLLVVALTADRSYRFGLLAYPEDFQGLLPTAREMADSFEIVG